MRSIAIVNQNGGAGETSITANLAHAVAFQDREVTVIDFYPQSHLTANLGIARQNRSGVGVILLKGVSDQYHMIRKRERLNLMPTGQKLNKHVECFPKQLLTTSILTRLPSFGKTAFEYKRGNNGLYDYESLVSALLGKRII